MTLVFRNKLLLVLLSISILFLLVTGIYFVYAIVTKGLFIPTEVRRLIDLPNILFFRYNFFAAIGSSFILFLYSMVTMYICYRNFEKTQAAEIIYFVGFCIGCALEGFRIWLPVLNVWSNFSTVFLFFGKSIFFGRFIAILNLSTMAILSKDQNGQQFYDSSLVIIIAAAALLANTIPIDTVLIPSNCSVSFGFEKSYIVLSIICILASFVTVFIHAQNIGSREYSKSAIGFLVLAIGYIILTQTDSVIAFLLGTVALITGTVKFLWNLHKFHTWK